MCLITYITAKLCRCCGLGLLKRNFLKVRWRSLVQKPITLREVKLENERRKMNVPTLTLKLEHWIICQYRLVNKCELCAQYFLQSKCMYWFLELFVHEVNLNSFQTQESSASRCSSMHLKKEAKRVNNEHITGLYDKSGHCFQKCVRTDVKM